MPTPTYTPIASTTLSSSQTSVTFNTFSGYRDLVLVCSYDLTATNTPAIRINSDTGSNYSYVNMANDGGSTPRSSTATLSYSPLHPTNSVGGFSELTMAVVNFFDVSATDKHKSILTRSGNTEFGFTEAVASRWANSSAITSITFLALSSTIKAGSSFSLYGIVS